MKSWIKFQRLILNILFYVFYVLLASIAFSFLFPTFLVLFWKEVLLSSNPIFEYIQIWITVVVLLITILWRKYFYLPLRENLVSEKIQLNKVINRNEEIQKEEVHKEENKQANKPELDIKIGKEIK